MKHFLTALLAMTVLASCGNKNGPGAASPQEAFEKFQAAGAKKDMGAIYDVVAPDEADLLVFGAMMVGSFSTMGDEAKGKEFDAIMKKYNLPDNKDNSGTKLDMNNPEVFKKQLSERLKDVKDKRGFCVEAFAFSEKHSKPGNGGSFSTEGTLKDLKESGDTATAILVKPEGKEKPMTFRKIGGRWYVGMPGM